MKKIIRVTGLCLLSLPPFSSAATAQVDYLLSDAGGSASTPSFIRLQGEFVGNDGSNLESENEFENEFEFENEEEAEEERIETERHDFTQSTTVVGRGRFQAEFGYTFFQNSGETEVEDSHATPELLLRFGLTEKVEFRLRYNEVWQFGEEDRSGSEDLRFGFKLRTTDQAGWIPESALETRFSAPTGGGEFSTDEVEFGLDYIYGWKISPRAEIYGSSGFSTNSLGDFAFRPDDPAEEEFMLYTQSVALGVELTERVTSYTEFFGLFTDGFEDDEENPVFFNVGVDYYVSDNFVLDVRAGTGINDDAEDLFFGMGGAFRF